jgi:hypothetical protein
MNTQQLIYTETDHKGQWQVVHSVDCKEGQAAHRYASGNGTGDQTNWDKYTVASREEFLEKLRHVYGDDEVTEFIQPNTNWQPCVIVP